MDTQVASKWIFKKEISLGDMVAISLASLAIVSAYFSLDKRVAIVEQAQSKQEIVDKTQDMAQQAQKLEFSSWLIRVESKVDRLLERSKGSGYTKD